MLEIIMYIVFGLALFFMGMHLTEQGLIRGSGSRLQKVLQLFTSNAITGVLTGTLVTAVLQSSSAVSVMVIGLVSAGVLTLYQAMGVILGANIGTTVTMHILTLQVSSLEGWLIAAGLCLIGVAWVLRRHELYCAGIVLLGFGLIFLGLTLLQTGVEPLQYHPAVMGLLLRFSTQPLLAILGGMIFTAIIQSSSATSGIVLTIVRQGMVSVAGAVGILLGANVGTCMTALLAGLKASRPARRVAYFHVLFNIYGVLLFIPILQPFGCLISVLSTEPGKQIAIAHTLFNVVTTLFILPFLRPLERLLKSERE